MTLSVKNKIVTELVFEAKNFTAIKMAKKELDSLFKKLNMLNKSSRQFDKVIPKGFMKDEYKQIMKTTKQMQNLGKVSPKMFDKDEIQPTVAYTNAFKKLNKAVKPDSFNALDDAMKRGNVSINKQGKFIAKDTNAELSLQQATQKATDSMRMFSSSAETRVSKTFGMDIKTAQKSLGPLFTGTKQQMGAFDGLAKSANFGERGVAEGLRHMPRMMAKAGLEIDRYGNTMDTATGKEMNMKQGTQKLTRAMKPFRMELLSVMFFGMQLQRTMLGLLQPAMNATGIFKIWGLILTLLFLPIALEILKVMLWLLDVISGWSKETKLAAGAVVIFLAALGTFLFMLGQLGLAWGGIGTVFAGGKWAKVAKSLNGLKTIVINSFKGILSKVRLFGSKMVGSFKKSTDGMAKASKGSAAMGGPIIIAIIAIIAIILILNRMWRSNWGGIRQFTGRIIIGMARLYDTYLKPSFEAIGGGLIILKDMIGFVMSNAGNIWKVAWMSMSKLVFDVWNGILSGVQFFVNKILTGPLRTMWDLMRGAGKVMGFELPPFPKLDLSDFKVSTEEMGKEIDKTKKELGKGFKKQLEETDKTLKWWSGTLNKATADMTKFGIDTYTTGEKIDAGLVEGVGFLDGAFESVGETMSDLTSGIKNKFSPTMDEAENITDDVTESIDANKVAIDKSADSTYDFTGKTVDLDKAMEKFDSGSLKDTNLGLGDTKDNFDESAVSASNLINKINAIPTYKSTIHEIIEKKSKNKSRYNKATVIKDFGGGYGEYKIGDLGFSGKIPTDIQVAPITPTAADLFNDYGKDVFGFKMGGIVEKPMIGRIGEAGPEAIIPLKNNNLGETKIIHFNPTIEINVEASSEVDIDAIKDKLSREWVDELKEMIRGR